jgi:hypothetical protein
MNVIVYFFLREDHEGLFKTITEWPQGLYDIKNVITAINDRLSKDPKNSFLLNCLAKLYVERVDKNRQI